MSESIAPITLCPLETTFDYFAGWLEKRTEFEVIRLDQERALCIHPARGRKGKDRATGKHVAGVVLTGEILIGHGAEQKCIPVDNSDWDATIQFRVIDLASERIEVECICLLDEARLYFDRLVTAIRVRWPEAQLVASPQDTEASTGDKLCEKHILVHIPRWEVYNHLRALCNNDALFALREPKTDQDLEALTVADAQARKPGGSARGAIIGTVRLLPVRSDTDIMFVAKDALFYEKITEDGRALFGEFIRRVTGHFDELDFQQARVAIATPVQDSGTGADKTARPKLRQILTERFSGSELRNLCFDLGIEYDDLPGEGTGDKARELLSHCLRRGRIPELIERGKQLRPDVPWSDTTE